MIELRYFRPALRRDYARAGIGIAMCVGLILLMPPRAIAFWPLIATAALFLAFGVMTALKHATVIELDETGVRRRMTGLAGRLFSVKAIDFASLDGFALRYFGRRRDRHKGIVELSIRAGQTRLTVDQALEEFDDLVRRCRGAAERRSLALDANTQANLVSLRFG